MYNIDFQLFAFFWKYQAHYLTNNQPIVYCWPKHFCQSAALSIVLTHFKDGFILHRINPDFAGKGMVKRDNDIDDQPDKGA